MDTLSLARTIVTMSSSIGAGMLTTSVIKHNAPRSDNRLIRGCQYMGLFAISGAVGSAAAEYTGRQFDELVEIIKSQPTKKS